MAGTISLSMTQQIGLDDKPLRGGKIFFIQAGTTSTPQSAYQDSGLTIPWPNPITLDDGRIPQLFFDDGSIKVRIEDANGVQQLVADNLLVVGPSGGGGGGSSVDATTILATGDIKIVYGDDVITGFVRANGKTIGSASSGGSERANADCQALFQYLWGVDSNLTVSGGRGVSAAADWAANKMIALPDCRGRSISGLDDMGNSAAGRLTETYFGTAATALGAAGGSESKAILKANFPNVDFSSTSGDIVKGNPGAGFASVQQGTGAVIGLALPVIGTGYGDATVHSGGSGTPLAVASPSILMTIYIKL